MGRCDLKTVAVVLATVALSGSAWGAQDPAEIWVGPPAVYASVGELMSVTIRTDVPEIAGAIDLTVDFDPAVLEFAFSTYGNIWAGYSASGAYRTAPNVTITNGTTDNGGVTHPNRYLLEAGTDIVVWNDVVIGAPLASHSIVTLYFLAVGEGSSSLTLGVRDPAYTTPIYVARSDGLIHEFAIRNVGFVSTNPEVPLVNLAQSAEPAGTPMAEGFVDTDGLVSMRAELTAGATPLLLEVEVKPLAEPFDGANLIRGNPAEAATGVSEVTTAKLPDGSYHWRVRVVSDTTAWSPWTEFAPDPAADFVVTQAAPRAPREKDKEVCGLSAGTGGAPTGLIAVSVLALLVACWRLGLNR